MKKTIFAGLTVLEPGEGLSTDNGAFIDGDRIVIDHLLEIGAKTHRHTGLSGLADPGLEPVVSMVASAGTIPANLGISVGYTLEDAQGGETMLSPTAVVSTREPVNSPPAAPSGVASYGAGSLQVNTYFYAVTFTDGEGGETALGPAVQVQRAPGYASGQIALTQLNFGIAAAGGKGWRLYRAIGGEPYSLLAEGAAATSEFVDNGSVSTNCSVHPPAGESNTTRGVSTLLVTLPSAPSGAVSINLYATVTGEFGGGSLLGTYPVASAGQVVVYPTLELQSPSPPDVNLSIGGAHQIDPDTELLDWHWKRPVANYAELGAGEEGDVKLVEKSGELYGVLGASAAGPAGWSALAGGGGSGSVGPEGPAGPAGPTGPTGASGASGARGPEGPAGASGARGAEGPEGPRGFTGPEGPAGPSGGGGGGGPSPYWENPVWASGSLGSGVLGDVKMVESTGQLYGVLSASATVASGWVRLASAGGPEGPRGAEGPRGVEGPQGSTGAAGASGAWGPATWTPHATPGVKRLSESSFEKINSGVYTEQVYSSESFTDGCFLSFSPATTTKGFGFGLATNPTASTNYTNIDYWINCTAGGAVIIREFGTEVYSGGTYKAGDIFSITYDGYTVRYFQNGVLLREVARPEGSSLFLDSAWNQEGSLATNVHFGPMGERGASGASGARGIQGAEGPGGPQGSTGGTGPAGPGSPYWLNPVSASGLLGSGILGDVRMVESTGQFYGVLGASATVASAWVRLASAAPLAAPLTASATGAVVENVDKLTFVGSGGVNVTESEPAAQQAQVLIEGGLATLGQEGMGVIVIPTSLKGMARPQKFKQYTWFCKEQPTHLGEFDIWIETGP